MFGKIGVPNMLASGRLYANFYARLSPECDDRRRRLEKALGLRSSGVLELVLNEFEDRFVSRLSETQRADYFNGALDASHEGRVITTRSPNTAKLTRRPGKKMPRHKTGAKKKVGHDLDSTAFPASQ
jgi:hypothetical protein